jgi:hypothetical protein
MTTGPHLPRDLDALERDAAGAIEAIRTAARLMRAIAPLAAELRALQEAMHDLQAVLGQPEDPRPLAAAQDTPLPAAPPAPPAPAPLPAPDPVWTQAPEPPPAQPTEEHPAVPWSRPIEQLAARPAVVPFPTPRAGEEAGVRAEQRSRTITVTVSRAEGPLDLVRVHGALDAVEGISGLALASYTRGRAVILLDSDRTPEQLGLYEALQAAFPEGVSGRWLGPNEFLATIGLPEAATGSP